MNKTNRLDFETVGQAHSACIDCEAAEESAVAQMKEDTSILAMRVEEVYHWAGVKRV